MWLLIVLLAVIALFVVGGFVIGLTFKLLWIALVGLVVGALARLVLPGPQALGWLRTVLYGVAGSLVAALAADAFELGSVVQFLLAIAAAAVLISLFAAAAPRRV